MTSNSQPMQRLQDLFERLVSEQEMPLEDVYTDDVSFRDPFHVIDGRDALRAYFERLNENVKSCTFTYHDVIEDEARGVVTWTMKLETRRGPRGVIAVDGATHLTYKDGKIASHRDYFDAAQMVYEHVPLLGGAIRQIKKRM